jgi:CRAL/TRIO domain
VVIVDFTNYPIDAFNPSDLNELVLLFVTTVPCHPVAIHFINVAPTYQFIINIIKTFMNEKIRKRVGPNLNFRLFQIQEFQFFQLFIHKTLEDLHQHVKPEDLPQEFGGTGGPFSEFVARWKQVVGENVDVLTNLQSYGIDETKRLPSETITIGHGSFRSLTID